MPRASDAPEFIAILAERHDGIGVGGAKGGGEGSLNPIAAAVAEAIYQAAGVRLTRGAVHARAGLARDPGARSRGDDARSLTLSASRERQLRCLPARSADALGKAERNMAIQRSGSEIQSAPPAAIPIPAGITSERT